jgi:hypothetical protein
MAQIGTNDSVSTLGRGSYEVCELAPMVLTQPIWLVEVCILHKPF